MLGVVRRDGQAWCEGGREGKGMCGLCNEGSVWQCEVDRPGEAGERGTGVERGAQ